MDPRVSRRVCPLGIGALAACLAACASPPRSNDAQPIPTVTASPDGDARAPAAIPASAAPSAAPAPAASASAYVAPPRDGAPGSTRGTISCGSARCKAPAQACVFTEAGEWTCVDATSVTETGMRCDDGLDCPRGETCCVRWDQYSPSSACVARADVSQSCRAELCEPDGAKCPAGTTCEAAPAHGGTCEAPKGPATCTGGKRCAKDKPICALTKGGPACVAVGTPEHAAVPGESRFTCTKQSDCHGDEACSYVFGEIEHDVGTFCSRYSPAYMGSLVCDPSDKTMCGPGKGCVCEPGGRPELPWLGVVSWR